MSEPLRYVVLRHEGVPDPHFDLMFETSPGSKLSTWRSATWPPAPDTPLTALQEHRAVYLTYEGPLTDDRGTVRRVASGRHRVTHDGPAVLTVALEDGRELRLPRA